MATTKTATVPAPEAKDAQRSADESVLAGVTINPEEVPARRNGKGGTSAAAAAKLAEIAAANGKVPAPARRRRTATATAPAPAPATAEAPAKATPARKAPAKATKTTAAKTPAPAKQAKAAPAPVPAAPSARDANQVLAREVADLLAKHFGDRDVATQTKVANWVKSLPTGGAAWKRYWPEGFARPTSADWVVPEGETL
jgi:hypothetical protein